MLAGINEFFVLHPTVWSHEVTVASETVTVLERRYLGGKRRFILLQFYNSARLTTMIYWLHINA